MERRSVLLMGTSTSTDSVDVEFSWSVSNFGHKMTIWSQSGALPLKVHFYCSAPSVSVALGFPFVRILIWTSTWIWGQPNRIWCLEIKVTETSWNPILVNRISQERFEVLHQIWHEHPLSLKNELIRSVGQRSKSLQPYKTLFWPVL